MAGTKCLRNKFFILIATLNIIQSTELKPAPPAIKVSQIFPANDNPKPLKAEEDNETGLRFLFPLIKSAMSCGANLLGWGCGMCNSNCAGGGYPGYGYGSYGGPGWTGGGPGWTVGGPGWTGGGPGWTGGGTGWMGGGPGSGDCHPNCNDGLGFGGSLSISMTK